MMTAEQQPKILKITRRNGVAGQYELTAHVEYPDGAYRVTFVGSSFGGPVVMVTDTGTQHFVTEPDRFGPFGESWVRRFFGGVA